MTYVGALLRRRLTCVRTIRTYQSDYIRYSSFWMRKSHSFVINIQKRLVLFMLCGYFCNALNKELNKSARSDVPPSQSPNKVSQFVLSFSFLRERASRPSLSLPLSGFAAHFSPHGEKSLYSAFRGRRELRCLKKRPFRQFVVRAHRA